MLGCWYWGVVLEKWLLRWWVLLGLVVESGVICNVILRFYWFNLFEWNFGGDWCVGDVI